MQKVGVTKVLNLIGLLLFVFSFGVVTVEAGRTFTETWKPTKYEGFYLMTTKAGSSTRVSSKMCLGPHAWEVTGYLDGSTTPSYRETWALTSSGFNVVMPSEARNNDTSVMVVPVNSETTCNRAAFWFDTSQHNSYWINVYPSGLYGAWIGLSGSDGGSFERFSSIQHTGTVDVSPKEWQVTGEIY